MKLIINRYLCYVVLQQKYRILDPNELPVRKVSGVLQQCIIFVVHELQLGSLYKEAYCPMPW